MLQFNKLILPETPILLAPLEGVTDLPFRKVCRKLGADMVYSEFVSSEALVRVVKKSIRKMFFSDDERPLGIQIYGHNEASMVEAALMAEEYAPDVIDLNFGCPARKVIRKGAGSAMLGDEDKLIAITKAVVKATKLPVSVKTRLGVNSKSKNIVQVAEKLQDTGIVALTIHGRTMEQQYTGIADWTLIGEIKNNPRISIPIIGNGDIKSAQNAKDALDKYGVDAIMIGRAAIGYPWIFNEVKHFLKHNELLPLPSIEQRIEICRWHINESIAFKGEQSTLFGMRKYYPHYFKELPDFKPFKIELMLAKSLEEVFDVFEKIRKTYTLLEF